MNGSPSNSSFSGPPISWRTDLLGLLGVTLLVAVLLWPTLDGSRTLMSDSWLINYPWAVEGSLDVESLESALGQSQPPAFAPGEPYVHAYDIYLECLPWYAFAKSELYAGRWPHWNPYSFCGAPLYANHLVPLTHPPLLIAILPAPVQQIHTVATFLTWWLAGLGLYLYLRRKRLQPIACLTAVALYLTCGHYMPLVPFQMAGLMYYPWLMWTSDVLDERPSFRALLPFSLLIGLQLAAGHPAFVAPFLYLLIIHRVLIWTFSKKPRSWWMPRVGYLVLGLVLGGFLSSIQNIPTWNYLGLTPREVAAPVDRTLYNDANLLKTAHPASDESKRPALEKLAFVVSPVFQREIELEHPFVGAPLVLLALLGLLVLKPVHERRAMTVLLLIFGFIAIPPVFERIAPFIPGLDISPYNPYATAQFILVILAAIGLDGLMNPALVPDRRARLVLIALAVAGIFAYALPLVLNGPLNPDTRWESEQLTLGLAVLFMGTAAIIALAVTLAQVGRTPLMSWLVLPLLLTVGGILGHFYQYPVFPPVPVMPLTPSIQAMPRSDMYRVIRHSSKPPVHSGSHENPLTFGGNLPMWAGWMDSQGYDSLVLKGQWDILKALDPRSLAWNGLALPVTDPAALRSPILDAMAVRWVISDDPNLAAESDLGPVGALRLIHSGGLVIYERPGALPRWYLSSDPEFAADSGEAVEMLDEKGLVKGPDSRGQSPRVILEAREASRESASSPGAVADSSDRSIGTISPVEVTSQRLEFRVNADRDCYFVLSDAWHPGWRAYVDGDEVRILRANGSYRAVALEAGDHTVVFRFDPRDFTIGAVVSLAALFLLLLATLVETAASARGKGRSRFRSQ